MWREQLHDRKLSKPNWVGDSKIKYGQAEEIVFSLIHKIFILFTYLLLNHLENKKNATKNSNTKENIVNQIE